MFNRRLLFNGGGGESGPPTTLEFDIDQPGGSSLSGATITISYNDETVTKTADNKGLAVFYEVPTNIDIPYTVTAVGYEDYTGSVNIAPGEYGWVNVEMSKFQPQGEETLFIGLWGGTNYGWCYGQTGDFVGWEGMTVQNFPQAKANLKTLQTNKYNNFLLKFMDIDPAVSKRRFTLTCEIPGAGFSINENVVASNDGKIAQYAFKSPPSLYEYFKANYGKWVVAKVAINIQKWG